MATQKKKRVSEFWSTWNPAGIEQVCSVHRTRRQAVKEALRCERTGGAPHEIVQVTRLGSAQSLKRSGRP